MDWNNILKIAYDVFILGSALLFYYGSKKNSLVEIAENAINYAEEQYKDATNAGGKKFECAIDFLYKCLPAPLAFIFPRSMVASIVQSTFDRIEEYAKMQLDKASDKFDEKIEDRFKK